MSPHLATFIKALTFRSGARGGLRAFAEDPRRIGPYHQSLEIQRRRLLLGGLAALVTACSGAPARWGEGLTPLYARPDRDEWPDALLQQGAEVQAMYRYAVANEDVLRWMPCFCGCVNGGHGSNFDCYVRARLPDGRVQLDTMSFG